MGWVSALDVSLAGKVGHFCSPWNVLNKRVADGGLLDPERLHQAQPLHELALAGFAQPVGRWRRDIGIV